MPQDVLNNFRVLKHPYLQIGTWITYNSTHTKEAFEQSVKKFKNYAYIYNVSSSAIDLYQCNESNHQTFHKLPSLQSMLPNYFYRSYQTQHCILSFLYWWEPITCIATEISKHRTDFVFISLKEPIICIVTIFTKYRKTFCLSLFKRTNHVFC